MIDRQQTQENQVKSIRILYMEDEVGLARLFQRRMEQAGFLVDIACDGQEGLTVYDPGIHDVIVVDYKMPYYNGLEVLGMLTKRGPLPPAIMLTGSGDEQTAVMAMKLGAGDYIVKDMRRGYLKLLPVVIDQVINRQRLAREKQRAEEALQQHALELQARNEELNAFAHTVAHDLQNPLSLIIGYADSLDEGYDLMTREEVELCTGSILEASRKMNNIIEELLLLAGVRQQEVEPEPIFNMSVLVAESRERLTTLIKEYRAEIIVPDDWPVALGYGPWIEEVWTNYISNAIKYGGHPPRVEIGATTQENGQVHFWVQDNGPGLTAEEQARLFTPFTRLDQVRAKGHGLGLSIVRRIVEKLGGQVGIESEHVPGRGCIFSFTLPAA
ncbi:MAG: hybrid sensor histidine kinase/response regulator [Anaerolineae bacterium]|nr:hybrid sensor histidine kinase/response regulator [Anaerolineae bacterium]